LLHIKNGPLKEVKTRAIDKKEPEDTNELVAIISLIPQGNANED
jgi:hypothetical protein